MYIPLDVDLPDHPKTRRLRLRLGCDQGAAVGYLACLWSWAFKYAPDGDLSRFDIDEIEDACGWSGEQGVLHARLVECGWIDDGKRPTLHDWSDHSGKEVARRANERRRSADRRAASKDSEADTCTDRVPTTGRPPVDTRSDHRPTGGPEELRRAKEKEKTLHKCSAAVGDDSAAADSDDLTCSLRDLPDTIRDDEELWSLLQSVLGRSAGALFNAKAKSGHAVTLRRMIGDLCAFTGNAMAGVPCERRRPACRSCLVHVLRTIAAADEPVKLAQHLLDSAEELADYVPEAMVEMCRMVEKGAPPSEFAKMLGRSMSADLGSTEVDEDD